MTFSFPSPFFGATPHSLPLSISSLFGGAQRDASFLLFSSSLRDPKPKALLSAGGIFHLSGEKPETERRREEETRSYFTPWSVFSLGLIFVCVTSLSRD